VTDAHQPAPLKPALDIISFMRQTTSKKVVKMYFRPAEWRKNKTIWLAWPYDSSLWGKDLAPAQEEFVALVLALKREEVVVIAPNEKQLEMVAARTMDHKKIVYKVMPYGDIWLRDTFPIFVKDQGDETAAVLPQFNGWGQKYLFDDDLTLSKRAVEEAAVPFVSSPIVFEGGAIECDGEGTLLTTEQCLLNPNRNPSVDKKTIENEFALIFGATRTIWLKQGLKNDHTDGHIDTLARFIAPQTLAIMVPANKTDPNFDVLLAIEDQLRSEVDAKGRKFNLVKLPSPGEIFHREGPLMPASYLNFLIGDETLIVPLYGARNDQEAVEIFRNATDLKVVGLSAKAILSGGGAFHCISQEYFR
jgi:agmatine deiminase